MTAAAAADLSIYADRLRRTQAELERQGVDALIVGPSADRRYLLGGEGHPSERMSVLVLPQQGDPAYVVPTFEAPVLAAQRDLLAIHTWEETQSPAALVASVLGGRAGTVAVGDQLWSVFLLALGEAMPGTRWVPGGPVLRPLRVVKDGRELDLLKEAARRLELTKARLIFASGMPALLTATIWARFGARAGLVRMIALSLTLTGVSNLLIGLAAQRIEIVVVLRALGGLSLAGFIPLSFEWITQQAPASARGRMAGFASTAMMLGNVIGPLLGGWLAVHVGLPATFWVPGTVLALVGVILLVAHARDAR
jgi:MFS family permease